MQLNFVRITRGIAPCVFVMGLIAVAPTYAAQTGSNVVKPLAQTGSNAIKADAQTGSNVVRAMAQTGSNSVKPLAQTGSNAVSPKKDETCEYTLTLSAGKSC